MARVVVIDEFARWGIELSKELDSLGYGSESFSGVDSFLRTLSGKEEVGLRTQVDVIVLALHGRGAAATWYEMAVDRVSSMFSRLDRNIPAFIFAPDTSPDGTLVRFATDCQAVLIQRSHPDQIPTVLRQVGAVSRPECDLPTFYGEHSCTTHPFCSPDGDMFEVGIETADGDVAVPLSHAPRIYFDYMARNVSVTRPRTAMRIVQGMLESPFHHEALDGRIALRSFITNFARICHAVNPPEDADPSLNSCGPVAIRNRYVGKETVYAVRCRYNLRDNKSR